MSTITTDTTTLPRPPQPLDLLDDLGIVPATALIRLTSPGASRWAWGVWARDLVGPHRHLPRVSLELAQHGAPARPAGPRKIQTGVREGRVQEWDERLSRMTTRQGLVPVVVDGEHQPARAAVPPLQRLLAGLGDQRVLVELVELLSERSGRRAGPAPDAVPEMFCDRWPVMRSVLGEVSPPLRWSEPVRRRVPGGGQSPLDTPVSLWDLPRAAPAVQRHVEGLEGAVGAVVASDGRLLALRALVARYVGTNTPIDPVDVEALASWVVGRQRATVSTLDVAGQREWLKESAWPGHRVADRELASASPQAVAELLLTEAGVGVTVG